MYVENKIDQLFGKRNPFKVPEGYFSELETQLLNNMAEDGHERKTILLKGRTLLLVFGSAAAILVGILFYIGGNSIASGNNSGQTGANVYIMHENGDNYIDQVSDYAMLDNSDLYSYFVGE